MTPTTAAVHDVVESLAAAEEAGDVGALSRLIADDFLLIGPLGFLLEKEQWLEQWRAGNLRYARLVIRHAQVRTYGDVAVVVGIQEQEGDYQGRAVDGRFRLTLIVRTADGARVVGAHLSLMAAPPDTS
jgi:ketosteroid isomerase-like protein